MTPRMPLRLALVLSAILVSCSDPNEPDHSPVGEPELATSATSLVFYQVSAGASHTCAVTTDSRAYCWGDNSGGKLGDGTTTDHPTPVAVAGGLRFHSISAGYLTTCGVTTDQRAYCWGYNGVGTIGDGTTTTRLKPVPVRGGRRFSQIETSMSHTCGVSYPDHRAYCWGSNL
jgi:alpha-tubulin suppressor-like RCC1 family protein